MPSRARRHIIFDSSSPLMFLGGDTNIASAEKLLLRKVESHTSKCRQTKPSTNSEQASTDRRVYFLKNLLS
ncbi:hypothetical protein K503DRAFT_770746 [Rhizopogon vinicolor AM-OR11-026]|uniref:Uncharacterized protein n=1 Tax=Rhizopogon vinicolor AM-OR11-026 TaxID=1314800 RepID=A0A1B7N024_9AGAM|nr:hypothetical protein K503DRAFT_770746 [Rhizopogon vinicolor AM-OR11-026]